MKYCCDVIFRFFHFVKKPNQREITNLKGAKFYICDFITCLFLCLVGLFISLLIVNIVDNIGGEKIVMKIMSSGNKRRDELESIYSFNTFIAIMVLIGPVIEELGYRLYLRVNTFSITISFFLIMIMNCNRIYLLPINFNSYIFLKIFCSFIFSIILFQFLKKNMKYMYYLQNEKNYKLLFYFSALIFGFIHLHNFQIPIAFFYVSPIIVLPQFCYGLILGYFRLKRGFFFSLLIHCTINIIGLIPMFTILLQHK